MFLVSLAEGFIHLFQAAGIIFLDMMTGLIPMLICLLLAINFLMKLEAGRILRGHISMDDVISVPTEWLDWAGASSPVWFLGSHCFDLVRHLSGQEVVSVYAVGQKRLMVECGLERAKPADNGRWQFVGDGKLVGAAGGVSERQRRAYRYSLQGNVYPQHFTASRTGNHHAGHDAHAQQLFHQLPQRRCQRFRYRFYKRLCAGGHT